jgi:hypothetical protein
MRKTIKPVYPVADDQTRPAPGMVTARHDFGRVSLNGGALFSVREGVPMRDAFDELTALLTAAQACTEVLAIASGEDQQQQPQWAVVHVLTFANALVQAMHNGHIRGTA